MFAEAFAKAGRAKEVNLKSDMKTLVLGASTNPQRVSFQAMHRLKSAGHEVVAVGGREGEVAGIPIHKGATPFENVDTVTLYLNATRQEQYYDYIMSLNPRRIIYNPGAENPELAKLAREHGIENEAACTLVMLSLDDY